MTLFTELSLSAQTAYAQLLDAALSAQMTRSIADLGGSFASKTVKGAKYWYYQYTEPSGKLRQLYVGPESEPILSMIASKQQSSAAPQLARLARSAIALGCTSINRKHFRVINRLAEYGFFHAGGVLIGTHAFPVAANMLGVKWGNPHETQDIDLAHAGKNIAIALPSNIELSTRNAIESLNMGFLPVSGLTSKTGASYLNPREPEFRLDFLTTLHRGGEEPYEHKQIGITLQPLKFMEFSLEQVQQAVLFCEDGAVVINTPHPARYAVHKLIVFGERSGGFATKSSKDLLQAAALISFYKQQREWELLEAWEDLISRGKGWIARAKQGIAAMDRAFPEVGAGDLLTLPSSAA